MTLDEELTLLDSNLRRLKIEYEIFFSNPNKRPPADLEWKVLSLLRKFSDGSRMSFSQRYRYNEMAQRYAIYSDLWRKKSRIREEGYRRPQDALLSVQGVREEEHEAAHPIYGVGHHPADANAAFAVACSDPTAERENVEKLYKVLVEAKTKAGETVSGNFDSFANFVSKKTKQIRKESGCPSVEYTVETHDGQVRLKAKAKSWWSAISRQPSAGACSLSGASSAFVANSYESRYNPASLFCKAAGGPATHVSWQLTTAS